MNFTKELLEKAKSAQSAEELKELAKAVGMEMSAEEAEKYFAELHKIGELADEELNNVSGGCGDPAPNVVWGQDGVWKNSWQVIHDFEVGTRVIAYITPSTWKSGTIFGRNKIENDWGWYPTYFIHFDEDGIADKWFPQTGVGKII